MRKRTSATTNGNHSTLKDVAREAGVSTMTVWRVLNGETNVRESTRKKVQAAAKLTNYRPNIGARQLAGTQSYQFMMLYNNPNVGWMGQLLIGVMNSCRNLGYHLVIEGIGPEGEHDREQLEQLVDTSTIDGIILPPPICFNEDILQIINEANMPCVRIAGLPQAGIEPRVSIDNSSAAYELTNHLISLGHRDIAIIKGPPDYLASELRYKGFCAALRDNDITLRKSYIKQGQFNVQSGVRCTRELLRLKNRPTALFAENDDMAAGALASAQEAGLKVPEDLSITGFDDAPVAVSVWPQLTTIRQPLTKMGESAAEVLANHVRMMRSKQPKTNKICVELDYSLVIRGSTGKCPH